MFGNTADANDYAAEFKEISRALKRAGKSDERVDRLIANMVADMRRLEQLLSKPLVLAVLEHVQSAEAERDRLRDLEDAVNRI